MPDAALLTPAETAHELRVSRRWIYRQVAAGSLPSLRLGEGPRAPLRIDREDLAEWLRQKGTPGQ